MAATRPQILAGRRAAVGPRRPASPAVPVPYGVLEALLAAVGHTQVMVDPLTEIRAGIYSGGHVVRWVCRDDCAACTVQALLEGHAPMTNPPPQPGVTWVAFRSRAARRGE